MQKMETITNKETGDIQYILRGVDIGKDVTEQATGRNSDDTLISVSALKSIVADAADYDALVAAIEAL